jgi:hypothetical protein
MNKLDKIHKKDPIAIKDRDVAIRNQFAETVRGPWLRRDLKKRIRDHPDLIFTDIREEATMLIQDEDSDQQQVDQYKDDIDVPVYASPWFPTVVAYEILVDFCEFPLLFLLSFSLQRLHFCLDAFQF